MRNAREEIEYHNRKFKLNCSARSTDGQNYQFHFPVPNATGFDNNYNQALIKFSKIIIHNAPSAGRGFDDVWTLAGGGNIDVDNILLTTDIPCRNCITTNNPVFAGSESFHTHYSVCIPIGDKSGKFAMPDNVAIGGLIPQGSSMIERATAVGSNPAVADAERRNYQQAYVWEVQDDRSIEQAGMLVGNPFGRTINLRTCVIQDGNGRAFGAGVKLSSLESLRQGLNDNNCLFCEVEVLLLPNPSPEDR
jgi:hypothetical protein